jgi:GDP-D-mannose dehydratase
MLQQNEPDDYVIATGESMLLANSLNKHFR